MACRYVLGGEANTAGGQQLLPCETNMLAQLLLALWEVDRLVLGRGHNRVEGHHAGSLWRLLRLPKV